jgi:hypothetical protein
VTNDPEELDPELDAEIVADDELDDELEDGLPDGFVVEGEDEDDDVGVTITTDDDVDEGSTVIPDLLAGEDPDDFEEELAPVIRVPEEEDDAPARRAGEFVCTSCYMVKADSQLAVKSRKVCRDCA